MPNNENLDYMSKVTIHELVHAFAYKIDSNGKRVKVLDEGVGAYLAGQMSEKRFATIIEDYKNNVKRSIIDFFIYNGNEFSKIKGYAY